ncbi:MAG: polyprenyl synthetase family protein [Bacteroidales bacterium]|nr:polyprenyl synthetase family protein [Bacteroidales bacterium]
MISESKIKNAVKDMFSGIEFEREPAGLYDPMRYMVGSEGKRIRPMLCLTAYSLFKDTLGEEIIEPARALELFHASTLIHDDIMDGSPLRRGRDTVWVKWGADTALLSGDALLIEACRRFSSVSAKHRGKVLSLFTETAMKVCEGQQLDLDYEREEEVSMEDYTAMVGLKTSSFMGCAAKTGAIIADAAPLQCERLYKYGYNLGMAFQITDDYLDVFGDETLLGKPLGRDIINCEKSWLTVRAMEKAADKPGLLKALAAPAESEEEKGAKIASVKNIYIELGVDADAVEAVRNYTVRAMEAVSSMRLGQVRLEVLRRFAEKLVGRVR